jgi:hypothetical protein
MRVKVVGSIRRTTLQHACVPARVAIDLAVPEPASAAHAPSIRAVVARNASARFVLLA